MGNEDRNRYRELARRLGAIRAAWRLNAAAQGLLAAIVLFGLPVAIGIAAGINGMARLIVLALSALVGGAALFFCSVWPLIRTFDILDAAFLAEKKFPTLSGRAASAVELWREAQAGGARFDMSYLSALLSEAVVELRKISPGKALNTKLTIRVAAVFMVFAAALSAMFIAPRIGPSRALAFIAPPYLPKPERFKLEWITGDIAVPVGGDTRIEARFSGNLFGAPDLIVEREGLEPAVIRLEKSGAKNSGVFKFFSVIPAVAGDMTYKAAYKKFVSKTYRITAVEPPRISSMEVRLAYPAHTGLLPDTRKGGGDLRAPYGTRAEFKVASTSPLSKAYLAMNGGKTTLLTLTGDAEAAGTLTVAKSGRYTVHLIDRHGFENKLPPEYRIESITDRKPEIAIVKPENDLNLPRGSVLPIRVEARDDYGIARINLNARVVGAKGSAAIPIRIQPGRELLFDFQWNLSDIEAFDGDTVEFYLSATDNDALTGPKTADSQTRRVHILSKFEDFNKSQKEQENIISRMESVMSDGQSLSDKFKNLAQNLNPQMTAGEKRQWQADAQRAMERQTSLEREMADISNSMKDTIERMKSNDLVNLDTVEKMRELNSLMKDIMTDDLKKLIGQIQKQLENVDLSGMDQKMLEAMKDMQKINDSLDQTIKRLKRMKMEQQLDALKEHFRQLAERQDRLLKDTNELDRAAGKNPTGRQKNEAARQSREEGRIQEEAAADVATMEQLAKDMKDVSPDTADRIGDLKRMADEKNLAGDLADARDKLGMCSLKSASRSEKSARDTMKQMSGGLDSMQQKFQTEMRKRINALIRAALRKTLDITEAHESAVDDTERLVSRRVSRPAAEELKPLADKEQEASEAAASLVEDVARLAAMAMEVPNFAPALAAEAAQSLTASVGFLTTQETDRALERQRNATLRLNQLAIALLDAKKEAGKPSKMSEWDAYMEQLRKMAESQQNLNSATQRLSDSGMPMPQLGQGLQSLAMQQQMLSQGIGKLSEEMKNFGESGARLSQIQEEMQEVQRALSQGRADKQVLRRQANVLRRLQDVTLSMRKESLDQKRVAEQPKSYQAASPREASPAMIRDALPDEIRRELDRLRKEPAPEGYEQLINNYYRDLLRSK
ncbi:MAG: DUF4175 family protein [bacterium]